MLKNNNNNNNNNENQLKKKGYHISSRNTYFNIFEQVFFSKRNDWVQVDSHLAPIGKDFKSTLELLNNQDDNDPTNEKVPLIYTNLAWETLDSTTFIRNQIYFGDEENKKLYDNCRSINASSIIRNSISNVQHLTDKYLLYKNLLNLKKPYAVPTILINKGKIEETLSNFNLHNFQAQQDEENNLFYLKDSIKNRSEGIHLFRNIDDALEFTKLNENMPNQKYLLQKEITPILIDQYYKFDVRIFIVIVFKPEYTKCYIYNDGIVRSTNTPYRKGQLVKESQLTNYCYQNKLSQNFERIYKLSAIKNDQIENHLTNSEMFEKIQNCTSDYLSELIETKLNHMKYTGFTIFGLDFIFDQNKNPYLLEINYSPSTFQNSPNDVPSIIQDFLKQLPSITFDPILENKIPILNNFIEINSYNFNLNKDNDDQDLDNFDLFS